MEILLRDRILTRRFGNDVALIIHLYVEHIVGIADDAIHCKRTIQTCRNIIQRTLSAKYTPKLHNILLDNIGYEFRDLIQNVKYTAIRQDWLMNVKMYNIFNLNLCVFGDLERKHYEINDTGMRVIVNEDSICNEDYLKIFEAYTKTTHTPCDLNKFTKMMKGLVHYLLLSTYDDMFDTGELRYANELCCNTCNDNLCNGIVCSLRKQINPFHGMQDK